MVRKSVGMLCRATSHGRTAAGHVSRRQAARTGKSRYTIKHRERSVSSVGTTIECDRRTFADRFDRNNRTKNHANNIDIYDTNTRATKASEISARVPS